MLGPLFSQITGEQKQLVVYTPEGESEVPEWFRTRNVTVDHRKLPRGGPGPFVVVRDGETFTGAIGLDDLRTLLAPPIVRPGETDDLSEGYRVLFEALDNSVFTALDRRQLLAASREIEDRAFRVGQGCLRAGFQSLSVFERQVPVYRYLAAETALDVHVYGRPDWEPPEIEGVSYHRDERGILDRYWFLAFDGGGSHDQACGLVARETDDQYVGFWSYDAEIVTEIVAAIERAGI